MESALTLPVSTEHLSSLLFLLSSRLTHSGNGVTPACFEEGIPHTVPGKT